MRIGWIVLCASVLFGCAGLGPPISLDVKMVASNDSGHYSDETVDVTFEFIPQSTFGIQGNLLASQEVIGVGFKLTNKSSKPIRILWDDSSLILDGKNQRVFHSGIKLSQREQPQSPTTVPDKTALDDVLVPTENVYYGPPPYQLESEWVHTGLIQDDQKHRLRVYITYEIDNTKKTVDVEFVISKAENAPPQPLGGRP